MLGLGLSVGLCDVSVLCCFTWSVMCNVCVRSCMLQFGSAYVYVFYVLGVVYVVCGMFMLCVCV